MIYQGVVIFVLYCVRRNDVRRVWLPDCLTCFKSDKKEMNDNPQNFDNRTGGFHPTIKSSTL